VDARAWLAVLFVASGVMPLLSFILILRDAVMERRKYRDSKPGTVADFDVAFAASNREAVRRQLITRPLRDTVLVGGGVVLASVASILSLYILG
jgi:hypothetical protein